MPLFAWEIIHHKLEFIYNEEIDLDHIIIRNDSGYSAKDYIIEYKDEKDDWVLFKSGELKDNDINNIIHLTW